MSELTSAERLQLLIDSVRDYAIIMLDPQGRVATWNLGAQLIKGYTAPEVIGKPIATFYTPEDRAAHKPEHLLAAARERGRVEDERWRLRKDGTRFWANVVLTAIRERGELIGFVKVTRDMTERRDADELRMQEEHRFRALVENARDYAIFMLDPTGRVASWNAGAERIKGYTAAEIIGQHFSKFYLAEDVRAGKCERELAIALRDGRFEEEGLRVRKDGSQFWANVVIAPLFDRDGNHIGFSKITRDLTDVRRAEHDRLQLAHAEEALRLRDEFLSIASHELRTPLVALQLQLDSLRAQGAKLDAKQQSKVERAGRNVTRLSDLITTLLDVSRIAQGRLVLARKQIDLGMLVTEVVDRLHESATDAKCTVAVKVGQRVVGMWDPLRMSQVVSNLLSNAYKYAAGTHVDVDVRVDGDDAVVCVSDRGPGIGVEHLERVFERFERAASSRHFGGMGLGLYVARQIVAAHGGTIRAHEREGGGAELAVRVPIDDNRAMVAPKDPS